MPRFSFKGKKLTGELYEDTREAKDKFDLVKILHEEGITVVTAQELSRRESVLSQFFERFLGRIKLKEKIIFANNLSAMILAGLSLSRALTIIERQTRNKKLKDVVRSISEEINRGQTLSHALANFPDVFPPIFVAMVNAGEESGKLPESLSIIENQLEKTYELRRKIRGAMIYPAIVLCVIIIIGYLMMIFMVPTLSQTFKDLNAELPVMTKFVIGLSDFLAAYSLIVIPVFILFLVMFLRFLKTSLGRSILADVLLRLPVFGGIVRQANSATTMRTLSSLISSGVGMLEAIDITAQILQNPRYVTVMKRAKDGVEKGLPLSSIFQSEEYLYPILVGEMVAVGEETGKLSDMLLKGALFYEGEVDAITKNLSTIVEPLLMIFIGTAVGFFAVSMIQPMYSLSNVI